MTGLAHGVRRVAEWWAIIGGLLLLAIMAVTSVNAVGFSFDRLARPLGGSVPGVPGYEDFVRLAIGVAALMFLPVCQAHRGHVTVDIFTRRLSANATAMLDRCWVAMMAALALFLAYWMTLGMLETRADNVLSPVLGWSVWPFYLPGVMSLLLWSAVAASQTVLGTVVRDEIGEHVDG